MHIKMKLKKVCTYFILLYNFVRSFKYMHRGYSVYAINFQCKIYTIKSLSLFCYQHLLNKGFKIFCFKVTFIKTIWKYLPNFLNVPTSYDLAIPFLELYAPEQQHYKCLCKMLSAVLPVILKRLYNLIYNFKVFSKLAYRVSAVTINISNRFVSLSLLCVVFNCETWKPDSKIYLILPRIMCSHV